MAIVVGLDRAPVSWLNVDWFHTCRSFHFDALFGNCNQLVLADALFFGIGHSTLFPRFIWLLAHIVCIIIINRLMDFESRLALFLGLIHWFVSNTPIAVIRIAATILPCPDCRIYLKSGWYLIYRLSCHCFLVICFAFLCAVELQFLHKWRLFSGWFLEGILFLYRRVRLIPRFWSVSRLVVWHSVYWVHVWSFLEQFCTVFSFYQELTTTIPCRLVSRRLRIFGRRWPFSMWELIWWIRTVHSFLDALQLYGGVRNCLFARTGTSITWKWLWVHWFFICTKYIGLRQVFLILQPFLEYFFVIYFALFELHCFLVFNVQDLLE